MKKKSNNTVIDNQNDKIKEKINTLIDFHINLVKKDNYKEYLEFTKSKLLSVMLDFLDKLSNRKK